MDALDPDDVPYGDDWDDPAAAAAWADASDRKRPWRATVRARLAALVADAPRRSRLVELGAGPGLLAECVLARCPDVEVYAALDFSAPMLALCAGRLAGRPAFRPVHASFRAPAWVDAARAALGAPADVVLSMQAIHELRHRRRVPALYAQIRACLAPGGRAYLCDHAPFGPPAKAAALYMTADAHVAALTAAGFAGARVEAEVEGLVLVAAERA